MNSQDSSFSSMPHMQNATGSNEIENISSMPNILGSVGSNAVENILAMPPIPTNALSNETINMLGMPHISRAMGLRGVVNHFAQFNPTYQPNYIFNAKDANITPLINQQNQVGLSYQQLLNTPTLPFDTTPVHPTKTNPAHKRATTKDKDLLNSQASENLLSNVNWSKAEDAALTSALLYISIDADVGTNQKTAALWSRVFLIWKEKMGHECNMTRTPSSLQQRWKKISQAVTKFNSYYDQLDRHPQSGTNLEDMKRQAVRLYLACTNKKEFKFEHCWEILRTNPKWCTKNLAKINGSNEGPNCKDRDTSTGNFVPQSSNDVEKANPVSVEVNKIDGIVRPQGRKACKDNKRKMNEENGMANALKNLQSTLQSEIELRRENSKKDFEFKQKIVTQEMEVKSAAEKRKLNEQELREEAQKREEKRREIEQHKNEQLQKKAQKRKEQHRIISLDVTKISGDVRKRVEIYQMRILNMWESDGIFKDDPEDEPVDKRLARDPNNSEDIHLDTE